MHVNQTPDRVDEVVARFCRGVNRAEKPVYVPVAPEPWAEVNDCFESVRQAVSKHGGEELNGWQVWMWPGVFIEAEHHCVWRRQDGTLVDITPKQNGATRILFIPDADKAYDHENHRRLDNVRQPLVRDRDVTAFLENARRLHELIEAASEGNGQVAHVDPAQLSAIQERGVVLFRRLFDRYAGKNARCPCGSGQKYKKCHGAR